MLSTYQKEIITSTVPVLEKNGKALTSYFYDRMLTRNPELKNIFNMSHQRNGDQAQALAGAILAYAKNIEDPMVLAPVIEIICAKHVTLNILPEHYAIVGDNLLHSISEVLGLAMDDPIIAAWEAAYTQLADLFIATEEQMYSQLAWRGWRTFELKRKVQETSDVCSFYLYSSEPVPQYKPGQYVTARVFVSELGHKQPRQYSLSGEPNGEYLRITVKLKGLVSTALHNLRVGQHVELSAPNGNFVCDPDQFNVLISAGVGITPMVSMFKASKNAKLIHAAHDPSSYALGHEFDNKDNVHVSYHEDRLNLHNLAPSWLPENGEYYLCGPSQFMAEKKEELLDLGIPSSRIHSELFS